MIAFIEEGMTIPMGTLTRNFLRFFRISPTQCAPNMFRVLGSIEALNGRMNLNLTHHDVNWIYNLHNLKGQGYYLKELAVRLIQCLPISNKGLKDDFLIFSRQWHDGLPCPVKEGTPGGRPIAKCYIVTCTVLLFPLLFAITEVFFFSGFNDFADPNSTAPLRAAHLILGYKPISHAF